MLRGLLAQIWMCHKRNGLTITGTSIRADICPILGKDSQSLLCWKRNLQRDIWSPGGDWQRFKRLPEQIMYGQMFGRRLVKQLRIEKNKNGNTRSQNWTMLEDWAEFTSLILMNQEYKEILERPMAPAMLWKRPPNSITKLASKPKIEPENYQKNSARLCSGISWIHRATLGIFPVQKIMKTTSQAKVLPRCLTTIWCTSASRCHKRWQFWMQKPPWTRKGKSSRRSQHGNWTESRARRRFFLEAQRDNKKVHFATLMVICHLKNAEWEPKLQKCKGRVVLRGNIVKDEAGAHAAFYWTGLVCVPKMTGGKVMDVVARLPDGDGQAADAVSAYTRVKIGGRSQIA